MKKLSLFLVLFFAEILVFGSMNNSRPKALNNSNGLVAYYPFNGNANDESGNGHDGIVNGGILVSDRFEKANSAYTFPQSADQIVLANSTDLNLLGGFTLNAWINYSPTESGIITKHNCGTTNSFYLGNENGQIKFYLSDGNWNSVVTNQPFTDNKWYMVTAVYDSVNKKASIFINGSLSVSNSVNYSTVNTAPITISGATGSCAPRNMPGVIDEVKIFSQPLSADEILQMYTQSASGLVAFYPFNGNNRDESGNENDPTYMGTGVTLTSDRFGNPDNAYYFDGNADSYIRIPADNFPSTDRTISFWFNADQVENHPTPLSYGGETCNNSLLMIINKGDYPNAYTVLSHCGSNFISAPYSEPPVNKWYYLTMTIKGETQKIFINGELQQTANTFGTSTIVAGKSAILGAILFTDGVNVYNEPTAGNFQGKMDDFRFYDVALTDAEVGNLYRNESDGLVAEYKFNGDAEDGSGNQNNGEVKNAVLTTDRYGEANKAYLFNGVDSYIEGMDPGNKLPTGNSSRSFAAWVKDYQYQQWGSNIFHYGTAEVAPTNFHFLITDVLGMGNGYGYGVTYGHTNLIDSTWHFVCGTYDSTDLMVKLFVDGKLDNSGSLSTVPKTILTTKWKIGLFMGGGTPMNGKLDEIRVFKSVLIDQEIQNLYLIETTSPILQQPANLSSVPTLTPNMQWNSTLAGAEFRFLLSSDSLFTTLLQDVTTTNQNITIAEGLLSEGETYFWRVRTILNGEAGPWTVPWQFRFDNTGLNRAAPVLQFQLKPNPANTLVKISYSVPTSYESMVTLELLNSLGTIIETKSSGNQAAGNHEATFDTSHLPEGVYYCRLMTGTVQTIRKMVVIHQNFTR